MQNMRTDRKKTDREQVSLQRIAQECNVSLMTVSRALRRLPSVAEETRKKVFEAAERLGYLRSGRVGRKADKREELHSRPVQIIAGETSAGMPRFHAELVLDLVRRLAACRYECVIRVSDGSYREFTRVLANASRADAEASIIVGSFTEKELRSLLAALPGAILVEDTDKSFYESTYSSFSFDNERAAALAVNRFLKTKREKILQNITAASRQAVMESFLGKSAQVLLEEQKDGYNVGHTDNFIEVAVVSQDDLHNQVVKITFEKTENNRMIGRILF